MSAGIWLAFGLAVLTVGAIALFITQYKARRRLAVLALVAGMVFAVVLWALTFMAWSFGGS